MLHSSPPRTDRRPRHSAQGVPHGLHRSDGPAHAHDAGPRIGGPCLEHDGRRWWAEEHIRDVVGGRAARVKRLLTKAAWQRDALSGVVVCCECGGRDYSHRPGCEVAEILRSDMSDLRTADVMR
jgi:hypothetical protein